MISAILFDFDGVVADTMEDNFLAWHHAFDLLGVVISRAEYFPLEGMSTIAVAKTLGEFHGLDQEAVALTPRVKEDHFLAHGRCPIYPELAPLLAVLRKSNISTGLVTGASRRRINSTLPPEISEYFRVVVTGDDVAVGKPDPESYLQAAKQLNLSPSFCLAVENAPLGIASAKAAGMFCAAVPTTLPPCALGAADIVVDDLSAVVGLVEANRQGDGIVKGAKGR